MKNSISLITSLQKVLVIICVVSLTVGSLYPLGYVGVASARDSVREEITSQPVSQPAMETVYVSQALFDAIAEWSDSDASSSNSRSNVSLVDFVQTDRPELANEVAQLVQKTPASAQKAIPQGTNCSCRIVVPIANGNETPFINSPSSRETSTEHYIKKMRKWPNKKHVKLEQSFYTAAHGAFHSGDGYRYHHHGADNYTNSGMTNSTELQFQMICTNGSGNPCEGCVGELELRAQYESTAKTRSDSAGSPFSNGARAGAGDGVMLTYDPPGAQGETVLMNKGVGSSHVNKTTYNAEAFLNLVKNAIQITVAVMSAEEGTVAAGNIEDDLMDETIDNLLGLIERDGVQGTNTVNMRAVYDTADSVPFQINPNEVHRFDMTTVGAVDMSGFGPYTKSWTDYGSSGLIVYTANNFTCNANAIPPQEQGAWFYADVAGPNSETTLRNNAAAKISVELGVPVTISTNMGVVNP